jgi:hypothetical protein
MSDKIVIAVDRQAADSFQQQAVANGIQLTLRNKHSEISFGARFKAGGLEVDATPSEIFELLTGTGPALVDGLFDTLERFRDRIRVFINGKEASIDEVRKRIIFSDFYK